METTSAAADSSPDADLNQQPLEALVYLLSKPDLGQVTPHRRWA